MHALYLKAPKEKAEVFRRRLIKASVFDVGRIVLRDEVFVFLPVLRKVSLKGSVFVRKKAVKCELKPRSLKDSLAGKLSMRELKILPSAFDVVGDIAVLEIPGELSGRKKIIAKCLLETFRNIRVVVAKTRPVSGEYRVRGVEVLAGVNRTVTVHKEHGCLYKLDVASAYFSPRLGAERMRVANKVKPGERVLVLFAGVGPYAVLIAKKRNPKEVVAVELNPRAVGFMRENVRINKVVVRVIEGDVRNVVPNLFSFPQGSVKRGVVGVSNLFVFPQGFFRAERGKKAVVVPNLGKFNRIIMPLPKDAGDFLDIALPALSRNGVIHFYDFAESTHESEEKVRNICKKLGYKIRILDSVLCGSYAPRVSRVCVDFKVVEK